VIVDALEDMKGQNIVVCDTSGITDLFDRVIVATGTSNRQTRALAKNVHDKVKQNGGEVFGSEGEDTGEWVLVDCGDAVVHILQPAVRDYYRLEDIWGEKQIAAADIVRPRQSAAAKKPRAKKSTPVAAAAKKPATKTKAAANPRKAGSKKTPAKKT
jgi:ribosome-associated protein